MASLPAVIRAAPIAGLFAALAVSCARAESNLDTVRALNRELLSHDSATEVLRDWCADHHLAEPAVIKAIRDRGPDKFADHWVREQLHVVASEVVRYRHVRLTCGEHVLSEADNWYLPDRLTPDMNRQLDETDTPFGVVVRSLGFHRRTLHVIQLMKWARRWPTPYDVLRHEALLTTGAGQPFSLVVETYTSEILGPSPPDR